MPEGHFILLSNFYGSYLEQSSFEATVIVNNAGIEQLASLGVDKLKELKPSFGSHDEIYVLIMAGLTDVLIKSVEQNKNKLEITPNSTKLIETKMQWANTLLSGEGATVIWSIMPPISLRMYHQTEGWNISKIPGMSAGLDKEQGQLNQLMLNYRNLCLKLNGREARRVTPGPFFTDMVAELTSDRKSMHLNTSFFEADGISPTKRLVENWNLQVNKIVTNIRKRSHGSSNSSQGQKPTRSSDPWSLPSSASDRNDDCDMKRSHTDDRGHSSRGLLDLGQSNRRRSSDVNYDSHNAKRARDKSPTSGIPSLLDLDAQPSHLNGNLFKADFGKNCLPGNQNPEQLATAMQLLAATMQLSGASNNTNLHSMVNMLAAQQKEKEVIKRREEEHAAELKRREEERLVALQRRYEEERKREESRRFEEELRKRQKERQRQIEEENRLREVQIAAQRAMEQQREQQVKIEAMQQQIRQAQLVAEQKAQLEVMATARKLQEQLQGRRSNQTPSLATTGKSPTTTLDRINDKLDRQRRDSLGITKASQARPDPKIANDPAWKQPVVLFSFVNRNDQRKPLRGIMGARIPTDNKNALSNHRSRGEHVYRRISGNSPVLSFLKLKVRRPGELTAFETKVASFNNRLFDMIAEAEKLIEEGKSLSYQLKREVDDVKAATNSSATRSSSPGKSTKVSDPKKTNESTREKRLSDREGRSEKRASAKSSEPSKRTRSIPRSKQDQLKGKESSLPPAELPKPRWDKSDNESDEELIWDDVELIKAHEDDEIKSVASTKEDHPETKSNLNEPELQQSENTDETIQSQSEVNKDEATNENSQPANQSLKEPNAAEENKESGDQTSSGPTALNGGESGDSTIKLSPEKVDSALHGKGDFVTIDETHCEKLETTEKSAGAGGDDQGSDEAEIGEGFVLVDETC